VKTAKSDALKVALEALTKDKPADAKNDDKARSSCACSCCGKECDCCDEADDEASES
jgi:hypothetical protein